MAALPQPHECPTLAAMAAAMEGAQDMAPRPYLGVSQIGHPCARHLWLSFHFAEERRMPAPALRAIEDGHLGEDVMAERLRLVPGVKLQTVDSATGKQWAVEACGGHVRGHLDGIIVGLLEAPKTPHVWEHKQVNEKKFAMLKKLVDTHGEKRALAHWDVVYHGQALVYMELRKLTRHYLTVGTPGGRDYVSVRTEADPGRAQALLTRAEQVIRADEPPLRLSEDPAWFECKWCPYHAQCHGDTAPRVNCRTCAHSTPEADGTWSCRHHEAQDIPQDWQRQGCDAHRFIPILLERIGKPVDADPEANTVTYQCADGGTFTNGAPPEGFTSAEIRACEDKRALTAIPEMQQWRRDFGATLVR